MEAPETRETPKTRRTKIIILSVLFSVIGFTALMLILMVTGVIGSPSTQLVPLSTPTPYISPRPQ
jgi:hypothetical protein